MPVDGVVITSTLPKGASFDRMWEWTWGGEFLITPTLVTADVVVWEVGALDGGFANAVYPVLEVGAGTPPGTVLTHTVEIAGPLWEERAHDNTIAWVDVVNPAGPNLRVDKSDYRWDNEGRINYRLLISNLGTTVLKNVRLTDTYALSTTWDGVWQHCGPAPEISTTHDAPNHRILIPLEDIDPGSSYCYDFGFDLDSGIVGVEGLGFTNTLAAPMDDDTYPADNVSNIVARSGPDLSVEKRLSGGEPLPAEVVTFTVRFGNTNVWPWSTEGDSTYLTDTFPSGMTFISATAPWDPGQTWWPDEVSGDAVRWRCGDVGGEDWREFKIFARISDTVAGGSVLTNTVEMYSASSEDVEFDYSNNVFALPLTVGRARVYLPLVTRAY